MTTSSDFGFLNNLFFDGNVSCSKRVTRSAQNDEDVGEARGGKLNFKDLELVDCCPAVVNPLELLALLGIIAGATFFIQMAIANMTGRRRRRKRNDDGTQSDYLPIEDVIAACK
uniref:Uncharacterized protein n=1 Tax=Lepeophtheirus salmonis TaxID=72036 RepID=A0A0K2TWG7_LEPSM